MSETWIARWCCKELRTKGIAWTLSAVVAACAGIHGNAAEVSGRFDADAPAVFLLNAQWLAQAKASLASGDASLRPALEQLLEDAEEAVTQGPFSVVDKTVMPPSGDKHDYMSIGPYWWPDPAKEDGLPYIRRDGEVNPEYRSGDTDGTRIREMTRAVETLSLAYCFTGEERWAERAALLLRTWFVKDGTRMNPHLEYGQAIPGRVQGRCYGIIETRTLTDVVDAVGLLAGSPAWTREDDTAIRQWFRSYLDWLRTSRLGQQEGRTRNNHGTWYDVQVAHFALFVGDRELAREVLEAAKTVRIEPQIEPDGRQPHELGRTLSFGYSAMNLAGMFALARLGEHVGVDLWNHPSPAESRIRAALDYLAGYVEPERPWPHPQIREANRIRLLPLLLHGAIAYDAAKYRELIAHLPPEDVQRDRSRLLYPVSLSPSAPSSSCSAKVALPKDSVKRAARSDGGALCVVVNPYANVDWDTFEHHRAALHLHTLQSDGGYSVKDVVMAYRQAGFTILSITDHDWNEPNPATPYPAEPRPYNFPANPTWPWTDYGCPSPEELGMVGIQGSELTFRHHINSYFSDYGVWYNRTGEEAPYGGIVDDQGNEVWEDDQLLAIKAKGGLAVLNHPGVLHERPWWVRKPLAWYVERFEKHGPEYLVGIEVTNSPTAVEKHDEGLWDQLLARFMPHRPIWGFGTDDMHRLQSARESDSVFVLAEHSEKAVRAAMETGQFYFRKSTRQNDVREREPAEKLFPRIEAIRVDERAGTITVRAANYDSIKWISAPESLEPVADYTTSNAPWPLGRVVHEGATLDYRNTPNLKRYVRVELHRSDGEQVFRTFTNPFGLASGR